MNPLSYVIDLGKQAWDWTKQADNQKALGTLLSGAGSAYNAYAQSKYSKSLLDLQKAQYQRGVQREEEAENNLQQGFVNSGLVRLS